MFHGHASRFKCTYIKKIIITYPKRAVRQRPHPGCGDQERTTAHAGSPVRSLCPVGQADQSEEDQSVLAVEKQKDNKPAIHHTAGPSTEGSRVFDMESLI